MALMKSSEIPEDAVVLTELEATEYVWDLVTGWESLSETWALRYGPAVLGGINAISGLLINRFYRSKLKLGSYGYISSVFPITAMPGLLTALYHRHLISTQMLLMNEATCPICFEMRSAAVQLSMGLAYPMVLGPLTALLFANRYSTFRVPQLQEGPKVMFKFVRKLTKPFSGTIAFIGVTQFVASSLITYFELRNNFAIRRKMLEIEHKLEMEKHN